MPSSPRSLAQLLAPLVKLLTLCFSLGEWMRSSSRAKPTSRESLPIHCRISDRRTQNRSLPAGRAAAATVGPAEFGCVSCREKLFAELHVDGLGAFATTIRLGFEGHALAFVHGGKA